jgi:importin subunit alpha-6/7
LAVIVFVCSGKPPPEFEGVRVCLPVLARLLMAEDTEVVTDACWALSYLSDGPNDRIQAVIETGCIRRLVELLAHESASVQTPALRAVGNVVTGDDGQTQVRFVLQFLQVGIV